MVMKVITPWSNKFRGGMGFRWDAIKGLVSLPCGPLTLLPLCVSPYGKMAEVVSWGPERRGDFSPEPSTDFPLYLIG